MKTDSKIIVLGYGLVGRAIIRFLKDNGYKNIKTLSKNFKKVGDIKRWYAMAEGSVLESIKERNLDCYLGSQGASIHHSLLGEYNSVEKYEENYRKKTKFFPAGSSKNISFRRYVEGAGVKHTRFNATPFYKFGDWVDDEAENDIVTDLPSHDSIRSC